jgi:lysophospholipase L1-like esterase
MQFTTPVPVRKGDSPISYDSKVVSIGSCFAVNISKKLDYFQFRNTVNPFGILFHPLAIEKFIGCAVSGKQFAAEDVFYHNERWHSFDAHSDLSDPDPEKLLDNLNSAISVTRNQLSEATHIIITLGTAWVYRNSASGELVASCHKVPQREFSKELLAVETIKKSLKNIISQLTAHNPTVRMIFTISPVRHIKDGFAENQRSKSNLIAALHNVLDEHPAADYFPSYEIMMDELRDYRFYAADMIHPNQTAIDFIWERFSDAWISAGAQPEMRDIETIRKGLAHLPFNPDSDSHRAFLESLSEKNRELQSRHPHIDFPEFSMDRTGLGGNS